MSISSSSSEAKIEDAQQLIRAIPDFPKPGIIFRDIFPLFHSAQHLDLVLNHLHRQIIKKFIISHTEAHNNNNNIDIIAGLDARGFLFGPILALKLNCPFVPIRKKGKLPGRVVSIEYAKEYGSDYFEIQVDDKSGYLEIGREKNVKPRVLVVDDLLATGGSALAATHLLTKAGADVVGYAFLIELVDLAGAKQLNQNSVLSLWKY